jgi:hypothetical protein
MASVVLAPSLFLADSWPTSVLSCLSREAQMFHHVWAPECYNAACLCGPGELANPSLLICLHRSLMSRRGLGSREV